MMVACCSLCEEASKYKLLLQEACTLLCYSALLLCIDPPQYVLVFRQFSSGTQAPMNVASMRPRGVASPFTFEVFRDELMN